ncbi:MAG: DNA starvation/stationary phase protection protein [Flavobacteriales bacterium]|nr:DNA starvation/stationary phase protection protein [Flavobacteriales bacterium]
MNTQVKDKPFSKLGFNGEEAHEVVESLNALLANYAVLYQKIRNFHWNVEGGEFFDIHEQLEEEYTAAAGFIDSIAERVRILGFKPMSTLAEYLGKSEIEESTEDLTGSEMIRELIEDYEVILSFVVEVADVAIENGDIGTETLIREILSAVEKRHWMFRTFIKKS